MRTRAANYDRALDPVTATEGQARDATREAPVKVTIWGTRGSTPCPGAGFLEFGGHTACVALSRGDAPPALVIDGGTGIRRLDEQLGGAPFRGTILLSHLHWDHVQGLPFFGSGVRSDSRVAVLLPAPNGDPVGTLERGFSPPHFPIGPRDLGWSFGQLEDATLELEGFSVLVRELPHRGGQTFGFRISDGHSALAYMTDHSPTDLGPGPDGYGAVHEAALELADGVDLLIHDAQFVAAEYPGVHYLGHASAEYACTLAKAAGAQSLLLFHHAPTRTDPEIREIVERVGRLGVPVDAAREAMVVEL